MIKEEIQNIKNSPSDLRKFGYTIGTVLFIIGCVMFIYNTAGYIYFTAAGVFLIFSAMVVPQILKPFNIAWMTLAVLLGFVMTRVILLIAFYLVLTPVSLIAKIAGKKFLNTGFDKNKETYWIYREKKETVAADYERQF